MLQRMTEMEVAHQTSLIFLLRLGHHLCSGGRGRGGARRNADASDSDRERQPLPHKGPAMACVARLIDLPDHEAGGCGLSCLTVDSDADTEVEDEGGLPSSSSKPSFIAETPQSLGSDSGLEEMVQMSALQGEETEKCGVNVRADAVGDRRD